MLIRPVLAAFFVAVTVLSAGLVVRSDASAAGTITGDVPSRGGLALVSWSGGSTNEIITASAQRGCTLNSVWSFVGGFPVGYLVGAPDFVNSGYLGVYPGGNVPAGSRSWAAAPLSLRTV